MKGMLFVKVSIKIVVFSLKVKIAFPLDKLFTPQMSDLRCVFYVSLNWFHGPAIVLIYIGSVWLLFLADGASHVTPLSWYPSQLYSSRRTVRTLLCLGFRISGCRRIDIDQVWVATSVGFGGNYYSSRWLESEIESDQTSKQTYPPTVLYCERELYQVLISKVLYPPLRLYSACFISLLNCVDFINGVTRRLHSLLRISSRSLIVSSHWSLQLGDCIKKLVNNYEDNLILMNESN